MKIFSFEEQERLAMENPEIKNKLEQLPHCEDTNTFEEFHKRIRARAELFCEIVGCNGVEHLVSQDLELQKARDKFFRDASEYWRWCFQKENRPPEIQEAFKQFHVIADKLEKHYQREKKCHRAWNTPTPGIFCYCDERSE